MVKISMISTLSTMAEASWIFTPSIFTASLADTIGLAKWRTHKQVFWEYFEERKERERGRVFHVPRICGRQTFWFNGVVYSRELFGRHKYRRARFSLASSETGFIPPSSPSSPLCFIYRGETRRDIEKFVSQGVLSDAVENSVLKLSSPGWILFSRSMVEDEAWFLNSTLNGSKNRGKIVVFRILEQIHAS